MFEITNGDKHINNKYYINFTYKSTPKTHFIFKLALQQIIQL